MLRFGRALEQGGQERERGMAAEAGTLAVVCFWVIAATGSGAQQPGDGEPGNEGQLASSSQKSLCILEGSFLHSSLEALLVLAQVASTHKQGGVLSCPAVEEDTLTQNATRHLGPSLGPLPARTSLPPPIPHPLVPTSQCFCSSQARRAPQPSRRATRRLRPIWQGRV